MLTKDLSIGFDTDFSPEKRRILQEGLGQETRKDPGDIERLIPCYGLAEEKGSRFIL